MPPGFFILTPNTIHDRIAADFESIKLNAAADLAQLEKALGPVDDLVPYYIPPDGQTPNPADHPEDNSGLVPRNCIFDLLHAWLAGEPHFKHAFILSDAGMGKTSMVTMVYLAFLNKLVNSRFHVVALKLGANTAAEIGAIATPASTILLLDALDEDTEAFTAFYTRMQDLLRLSQHCRKVVITCRAQFFPDDRAKPGLASDTVTFHGFLCSVLYLSPFTDEQVDLYLSRRFPDVSIRARAREIVMKMHSLKFRPMCLAYIDLLMDSNREFASDFDVYEALVEEWLNRELRKGVIEDTTPLFDACVAISRYIYRRSEPAILNRELIAEICSSARSANTLDSMSVEGRALLHRRSDGTYKFAHYSILEYFIAWSLLREPQPITTTDQIKAFIIDNVRYHGHHRLTHLDLSVTVVATLEVKSLESQETVWDRSYFTDCTFTHGAFNNASFRDVVIETARFDDSTLVGTSWEGAKLTNVTMLRARLQDVNFKGLKAQSLDLSGAKLNQALFADAEIADGSIVETHIDAASFASSKLELCHFQRSSFVECDLTAAKLSGSSLDGCVLSHCEGSGVNLSRASMVEVELSKCVFSKANFNDATLRFAKFTEVILVGITALQSIFSHAAFTDSDLSSSVMSGATFEKAGFYKTPMRQAILIGASFDEASLNSIDLSESQLEDASFHRAQMSAARLKGARATGCNFQNTNLAGANFEDADLTEASFVGGTLTDAKFRSAKLSRSDLSGVDLSTSSFEGTRLEGARLSKSKIRNLRRGKLSGAILRQSDLNGCDLDHADLSAADLTGASLVGALLGKANLDSASLRGANLKGANLGEAILTNTDLCGCDLSGARVAGAVFGGARYNRLTRLPKSIVDPQKIGMEWVEADIIDDLGN